MNNMLLKIRLMATKVLIKILGGEDMMIILLASRVILGRNDFSEIPDVLKPKVYEELKANGCEFLAGDYEPPTE